MVALVSSAGRLVFAMLQFLEVMKKYWKCNPIKADALMDRVNQ
jgi:hypothetical protein